MKLRGKLDDGKPVIYTIADLVDVEILINNKPVMRVNLEVE